MMRAEEELPDGSTCTVSLADGGCRSIISRVLPDGRCVWGQVFSRSDPVEHAAQVEDVVEHMRQNPEGFHRWWLPPRLLPGVPVTAATLLIGDVFDRLGELPDGSVDLVLTSPPFLALRSYLPADHPDKGREIGSEPTPAEFLDTLLRLTAEWGRVLAPHGSIAVELGDTYAGSGGAGGDYADGGMRDGQGKADGAAKRRRQPANTAHRTHPDGSIKTTATARATETKNQPMDLPVKGGPGWPLDKSLCGIPHLYHLSLAYGVNLLTGEPSAAGQWRVRNVVAWCRPNPAVGALGDKFRPATSYITLATRARDRWFDLDAVRTPLTEPGAVKTHSTEHANPRQGWGSNSAEIVQNPNGAPPLDWWEVPTEPYPGSHYATWPRRLLGRPIDSMCPREVCTVCGEPRRRITEPTGEYAEQLGKHLRSDNDNGAATSLERNKLQRTGMVAAQVTTVGWTDCGCGAPYRPGVVLDPFAGSGTTLAVATGMGRTAIGIDLDERNAALAAERVGMFLTVHLADEPFASAQDAVDAAYATDEIGATE